MKNRNDTQWQVLVGSAPTHFAQSLSLLSLRVVISTISAMFSQTLVLLSVSSIEWCAKWSCTQSEGSALSLKVKVVCIMHMRIHAIQQVQTAQGDALDFDGTIIVGPGPSNKS
eukprot:4655806-Amphidinium_carterae.1